MSNSHSSIKMSFRDTSELFLYFFFFIFFSFVLELIRDFIPSMPVGIFLFFAFKVYFYSGLLGAAIELLSEREIKFRWKDFHHNALRFWLLVVAITAFQYIFPLLLSFILPGATLQFPLALASHLQIIAMYTMAWFMVYLKFRRKEKLPSRKIILSYSAVLVITICYLADIGIYYLPKFLPLNDTYWPLVLAFFSKCLYFFEFIYFGCLILNAYPQIQERRDHLKEIYLINPLSGGVVKSLVSFFVRNYPPVFTVLKALTPKTYSFVEFNRNFWQRRYFRANKLVAISCYTSNCYEAYAIAKEFRKKGSKVVMGGPHVTYLPDEALAFCDSVVIGEAEGVWEEVIKDYENNSLKPKYSGVAREDYHKKVHEELMNSPLPIIREFLEPTRGCKYRCHFCTIPLLSGGKVRKKPVSELVELIKKVKKRYTYINLLDNNIYNDPAYTKKLFEALKPLGIKWQSFCTIDMAKSEEAVRLAKESGCHLLIFGYEIFGGSLENQQGGKLAMADRYVQYSKIIKKAGIKIRGNFIYGWDSDNIKSLFEIWKFAFNLHPFLTVIGLLTPLPGSRLYYAMLKDDRLTNLNWRQYDAFDLVFDHKSLTPTFLPKMFFPTVPFFFLLTTSQLGWIMSALFLCTFVLVFLRG